MAPGPHAHGGPSPRAHNLLSYGGALLAFVISAAALRAGLLPHWHWHWQSPFVLGPAGAPQSPGRPHDRVHSEDHDASASMLWPACARIAHPAAARVACSAHHPPLSLLHGSGVVGFCTTAFVVI